MRDQALHLELVVRKRLARRSVPMSNVESPESAASPSPGPPPFPGMIWIPGGTYRMGVPLAEPRRGWIRRDVTGGILSTEWIRARRHHRKRVGMDDRLVYAPRGHRTDQSLLHAAQSARRAGSGQLRFDATGNSNSEKGDQGRFTPLRPQLSAAVTVRPPDSPSRSTRPPLISGSGASCGRGNEDRGGNEVHNEGTKSTKARSFVVNSDPP